MFSCLPDVSPQTLKDDTTTPPQNFTHTHTHSAFLYGELRQKKERKIHIYTFPDLSTKEHSMLSHSTSRLFKCVRLEGEVEVVSALCLSIGIVFFCACR